MSAICQNFVQNAWKKELCSNCFKSKDEHNQQSQPKLFSISPAKSFGSILKSSTKPKSKRTVAFTYELTQVIGYGGEDWFAEDDEFELSEEPFEDEEFEISDEEDKELKRLTKANTDYNTVSLNDVTESKKSYASLMLGKPQVDSTGRKKTLLVTVTPFGQENSTSATKKQVKSVSHIPIAKNNKDTFTEVKSNVVLTSYMKSEDSGENEEKSLLDEISETLENAKNPIQIVPRKKTQKEIILTIAKPQANKENIEQEKNNSAEDTEKAKDKLIKSNLPEKKISIQRTPGIKKDQEKPAIYQTSVAKIELLNSKNLKHSSNNEYLDSANNSSNRNTNNSNVSLTNGSLNSGNLNENLNNNNLNNNNMNNSNTIYSNLNNMNLSNSKLNNSNISNNNLNNGNLNNCLSKGNNLNNIKLIKSEFSQLIKSECVTTNEELCKKDFQNNELKYKGEDEIHEAKEMLILNNSNVDSKNKEEKPDAYNKILKNDIRTKEIIEHFESSRGLNNSSSSNKDKVSGLPPQFPKLQNISFPQSRELAGEPDGRADSDENVDPPALPLSPPPLIESHNSFLQGNLTYDKPKVPSKPLTMLIRKPVPPIPNVEATSPISVLTTFIAEPKTPKLVKHDSNGSDIAKSNKRKAPKPPASEDSSTLLRNSTCTMNLEPVGMREIDRRDRASFCSPKIQNLVSDNPQVDNVVNTTLPEPAPRKSLSMSSGCLSTCDDKKRDKMKGRFSLKRFWRMGANKELTKISSEILKSEEIDLAPQPKPRLVIVHPLELNGDKVEVVSKPVHDLVDYGTISFKQNANDYTFPNVLVNGHNIYSPRSPVKPPPPPRNMEDWNGSKPMLPHPPKSQEMLNRQKIYGAVHNINKKVDTVYANIGEVRSAIAPNKPQRTASMREREAQQLQQKGMDNYECINPSMKETNENMYDYINSTRSSSPECDSSLGKNSPTSTATRARRNGLAHRSESNVDVSGDYFKFQNIPRSMSLTYCGSETESEIYSPYSFYGSESEVTEDDHEWVAQHGGKTHKLRSRKGRSIVHKNLEDNYGAVVVANHEALAQVLENIQQITPIQPALRGLKAASNLRWSDFSVITSVPSIVVGPRTFHQAMWGSQHVTLVISAGSLPTSSLSLGTFSMTPITEFSDLLLVKYLQSVIEEFKHIHASVAVFPWMQVHTIQAFGEFLNSKTSQNSDDSWKDATFVLLQLINALKVLQAQGIEELPDSLTTFVLCKEMEKETHSKLFVLQGLGENIARTKDEEKLVSLCSCASKAVKQLLPNSKLTPLIHSLLDNERAVSLSQVKSVLEFSLWGPSDVTLGFNIRERKQALQRWLDLQRATVLHGLVCTKVQLTVYEECHLLFLVRSTAKMMCDASLLLECTNVKNDISNDHEQ